MIFGGCVRDDKSHRHAIEKAALAKIVADMKDQLVSPGSHFISREQWRINATVVVGLHGFEFFRLIDRPNLNRYAAPRATAHRVQHMCGKRAHLGSVRASRAGDCALAIANFSAKGYCGEGAAITTRGACAPQRNAASDVIPLNLVIVAPRS